MDVNGKIFQTFLERKKAYEEQLNNKEKIKKQHAKGKLSARERIDLFFDKSSFEEIDAFSMSAAAGYGKIQKAYGDGVITGFGTETTV
ncbi:MAG: carboxyl transferase domain-containing protein [Bacteroidota bacterium]